MGYCESGKNVMTLFHNRGWEAIIADDLVGNTLLLVSFMVGGLTGCIGILVELAAGFFEEDNADDAKYMAFILGFVMGVVLCSILMSVIASSVNAVLVLFAEKPAEFQQNHPELSNKMREVWSTIYPGSI
jgi:Plasma-membrane choline transporter